MAGGGARHDLRHGEDTGAILALEQDGAVILLDRFPAADADADDGAHPIGVGLIRDQAGLMSGFARGDRRQQAEAVHRHQLLAVDAVLGKRLDLAADPHFQVIQFRIGDRADG